MDKTNFNLMIFSYKQILCSLTPLIKRHILRYESSNVSGIKLLERSNEHTQALVLTSNYELFLLEIKFNLSDKFDEYQIADRACISSSTFLKNIAENSKLLLGNNEIETNKYVTNFFINSKTFVTREKEKEKEKN